MKKERWRARDYVVIPRSLLTQKISPSALRLWIALASYCFDTDSCFPSNRAIMERMPPGTALNTLKAAKRELEQAGLIKRQRRFDMGRDTSSMYFLLYPEGTTLIPNEGNETITPIGQDTNTLGGNQKVPPLREEVVNKQKDDLYQKTTVDGWVFDSDTKQWVDGNEKD